MAILELFQWLVLLLIVYCVYCLWFRPQVVVQTMGERPMPEEPINVTPEEIAPKPVAAEKPKASSDNPSDPDYKWKPNTVNRTSSDYKP